MIYDSEGNTILYPEEPLKKKLLRNGFRLYLFAFIAAPAGYLIKVIASHNLSVEEIGLFYSILGVISLLATYNDLGLIEALQYYLPHYFLDKEYGKVKAMLLSTFYIQLISGLLIGTLTFIIAPWLSAHYFKTSLAIPILQVFSIYYIILNFFQVLQSIFIATQKVKWSQGIETIRMWGIVLFVGIGAWLNIFSTSIYTLYWLLGLLLATIICAIGIFYNFRRIREYKAEFNREILKKQRSYAFWIMIGTNVTILLAAVDQQLALYFFGTKGAGYWTNYLSLLNIINVVSTPIIGYLFPLLNELHKKEEYEKIKQVNRMLYIGFTLLGIMIGIVYYIRGPQIAVLFFGDKFIESGNLLRSAAPFIFLIPLVGISFQNLASRGQARQRVVILSLGIVTTILGSLLWIESIGIKGIIYGTVCGYIVMILGGLSVKHKSKI